MRRLKIHDVFKIANGKVVLALGPAIEKLSFPQEIQLIIDGAQSGTIKLLAIGLVDGPDARRDQTDVLVDSFPENLNPKQNDLEIELTA